jgi:asparagine synthetase B (glutamine-hydrolysing)
LREEAALPSARRESWWVAVLETAGRPHGEDPSDGFVVARAVNGRTLRLHGEPCSRRPAAATDGSRAVVWEGVLHNRDELVQELGLSSAAPAADADLLLAAYRALGEKCLASLRGSFAVILWNLREDLFVCARDPIGLHSLFFSETGGALAISDSIDALLGVPGVSRVPSRVALAMHLASLPILRGRTFFEKVERVPPGHAMRASNGKRSLARHWDPAPPGKAIDWVKPDEVGQFDTFLDRAVARCQRLGSSGIFLSGGLDSGSIAAVAVDNGRRLGLPVPKAFSLIFPDPECNEEPVQRAVAANLGLEQVVLRFDDALGPDGLLRIAMEISRRLPAPLDNFWLPAYFALTQEAKQRGCRSIFTGTGGDEWLSVTPLLAADLIPKLDVAGLLRLWKVLAASYNLPRGAMTGNLLWTCGVRPLLGEAAARFLTRWAPGVLEAKRRVVRRIPSWLSSDPSLRDEIEANLEPVIPSAEFGGFYLREMRIALDHYIVSMELEEDFEISQRGGLPRLHPFLDADLLSLLFRTPPDLLCRGGRAKGLVREMLAERFPALGFERQKKVVASNFFQSRLLNEGGAAWEAMGDRLALAEIGVIDAPRWRLTSRRVLEHNDRQQAHFVWLAASLESWLRSHVSLGDRT